MSPNSAGTITRRSWNAGDTIHTYLRRKALPHFTMTEQAALDSIRSLSLLSYMHCRQVRAYGVQLRPAVTPAALEAEAQVEVASACSSCLGTAGLLVPPKNVVWSWLVLLEMCQVQDICFAQACPAQFSSVLQLSRRRSQRQLHAGCIFSHFFCLEHF